MLAYILSLHLRHSTPSAERGSVHSEAWWPDCLETVRDGYVATDQVEYSLAVTTCELILSSHCAVTGTMSDFVTIDTLDSHLVRGFTSLLRAGSSHVPKL